MKLSYHFPLLLLLLLILACEANTEMSEPTNKELEKYIDAARKQMEKGKITDAEDNLNKAILTNPSLYDIHLLQGNIASMKGDYAQANNYYAVLITINRQQNQELKNIEIYNKMAENYKYMAEFDKADEVYRQAMKINKKYANLEGIANSQVNIGQLEYYKQNYSKSYDMFEKARKIFKETGNKGGLILTYNYLGLCSMRKGQEEKAINYLKLASNELLEYNDMWMNAFTNKNTGYIYILQGEFSDVQTHLKLAVGGFKMVKDWKMLAETKSHQGLYFREKQKFDEALSVLDEALEISDNLKLVADQASYLNAKALVYFHKHDFTNALKEFYKALEIRQKIGDEANQAVLFFSIASTFDKLDDIPNAITYLHRCLEIERRLSLPDYEADYQYLKLLQKKLENPEPYKRKDYDEILGIKTEEKIIDEGIIEKPIDTEEDKNIPKVKSTEQIRSEAQKTEDKIENKPETRIDDKIESKKIEDKSILASPDFKKEIKPKNENRARDDNDKADLSLKPKNDMNKLSSGSKINDSKSTFPMPNRELPISGKNNSLIRHNKDEAILPRHKLNH